MKTNINKQGRFRQTPQRLAVIEYLEGNKQHPSAEDIYQAVKQKFPTISFATVYNTLEALRKQGMVQELHIDPARKRFDPNTAMHNHLMCTRCGKVEDIVAAQSECVSGGVLSGYRITGSTVFFYGVCPECQRKEKSQ